MPTKREYLDSITETHLDGWITFGCIPAPGSRDKDGYGEIEIRLGDGTRTKHSAHNYTLRQAVGDPPPDKPEASHTCRMKACCNVAHLAWKSRSQNEADKLRDGTSIVGKRNGRAMLTDPDVLEILRLYATGDYLYRELADMYGVSVSAIAKIIRRETWTHL
jgi:hypothetical protein